MKGITVKNRERQLTGSRDTPHLLLGLAIIMSSVVKTSKQTLNNKCSAKILNNGNVCYITSANNKTKELQINILNKVDVPN